MVDLGIFGGAAQQPVASNGLNLSMTGAPGFSQQSPFAAPMTSQTVQQPVFQGMFGQQGQQYMQQPVAPPTELEIQIALLQSLTPVENFVGSPQMGILVELLSNLVTLSVMEILRSVKFAINEDDGVMSLDITSLPPQLQTISVENIKAQFGNLQTAAQQETAENFQTQQQIMALAQQSMMGGALEAALANDGLMERVGTTAGSFMGRMIGTR